MTASPIAAWRHYNLHYRLEGNQCTSCNKIYLPAAYHCACDSTTLQPYQLKPHGTLISFTQVTTPPADFKHMAPYCIGLVQLQEGPRIVAQLADVTLNQLHSGMRVRGVLRKLYAHKKGIIHYGIKFMPEK
jgi:uncharacterized OB-fold protein